MLRSKRSGGIPAERADAGCDHFVRQRLARSSNDGTVAPDARDWSTAKMMGVTEPAGQGDRRSTVLASRLPIGLAAVVLVAACTLALVRGQTASDGGAHVDGTPFDPLGLTVDPPDAAATALESEMVVEAIDGVAIDEMLAGRQPARSAAAGSLHVYRVFDGERVRDIEVRFTEPRLGRSIGGIADFLWFILAIAVVGIYTFVRRPDEPAAAALAAFAVCLFSAAVLAVTAVEPADLAFRPALWWTALAVSGLAFTAYVSSLAHLCLEFPRPPRWFTMRPWLVPILYLGPFSLGVVLVVVDVLGEPTTESLASATDLPALAALLLVVLGVTNVIASLWRARRDRATRRDLAVVGLALGVSLTGFVAINLIASLASVDPPDWAFLAMFVPLPAGVAFAVLRRSLFDLDVVVSRTIAYVLTSAVLIVAYIAAVTALQRVLRISELSATAPAAALVAVAFAPLRARAQRAVDRLMFGRRDDPYAVLADVARELRASGPPVDGLERLTSAVAGALRLPWVAVILAGELEPVVASGVRPVEALELPIVFRDAQIGVLAVGARSPGEPFAASDKRLLEDVAAQASVAVDALRLSDALARSRARAVTAAEDERQRIRHDLHDGLGPALTGISLQLAAAADDLDTGSAAHTAIDEAAKGVRTAKAEVRRLLDGMAPPQLERLGLLAALQAIGDQLNADPAVGTPGHPFITIAGPSVLHVAPEVEVAAYRIAAEAILNARRHARATTCAVGVDVDERALRIDVADDGGGVDEHATAGVGLASMRGRTEGLGGTLAVESNAVGTTVTATIPIDDGQDRS